MDALARISGVLAVVAVLGIIWWFCKKYQSINFGPLKFSFKGPRESGNTPRPLSVVARSRITPHHELHLVKALGQYILICTSPSGTAVLSTKELTNMDQSSV
jgi:hypothetical protein